MRPRTIFTTLLLACCAVFASAQDKHIITPAQGRSYIAAHQAHTKTLAQAATRQVNPVVTDLQSVTYPVRALKKLLAQPGAASLRIYRAMNGDQATFVLVAVDVNGEELAGPGAFMVDNGVPCPPFCNSDPTEP